MSHQLKLFELDAEEDSLDALSLLRNGATLLLSVSGWRAHIRFRSVPDVVCILTVEASPTNSGCTTKYDPVWLLSD
jgi:hypothetical protein